MRVLPLAAAVTIGALATTLLPATATSVEPAARKAAAGRQVSYTQWNSGAELKSGTLAGTAVSKGRIVMTAPTAQRTYQKRAYDVSSWTSPWTSPGFGLSQLIASWDATTPGDSWIEVRVRGRVGTTTGSWDVLGQWASSDQYLKRRTKGSQSDDNASVSVDTWKSNSSAGITSYQLQVRLMGQAGNPAAYPTVDTIGAVASRLPSGAVSASKPGPATGIVLDVPQYSQMIHAGDYPQYGGGGEAWCSPTSTSMVLAYYNALPAAGEYGWVANQAKDPWVPFAARSTYDYAYRGAGNWPFNTAYAATRTGKAFVTRMRSLRDAEKLIKAGIPVIASIAFSSGGLTGAPISSTAGHLVVIVGFDAAGNPVVNDPAAPSNATVRRTYDRGQFENVWLPTSGGLAYVISDNAHKLPKNKGGSW